MFVKVLGNIVGFFLLYILATIFLICRRAVAQFGERVAWRHASSLWSVARLEHLQCTFNRGRVFRATATATETSSTTAAATTNEVIKYCIYFFQTKAWWWGGEGGFDLFENCVTWLAILDQAHHVTWESRARRLGWPPHPARSLRRPLQAPPSPRALLRLPPQVFVQCKHFL